MSLDLTTRRTYKIGLTANGVYEFNLDSVYDKTGHMVIPNVVQVRNLNTTDIVYFDYTSMVSTTYYVQSINPLTSRKHVTSNNAAKLFLLSASNCNVEITIAYDPEPNVSDLDDTQETNVINNTLQVANNATLDVSDAVLGEKTDAKSVVTDTTAAGVIALLKGLIYVLSNSPAVDISGATINATISDVGITGALPAGDNNIGNVDVVSLPAIPTGANTIGKVKLTDGTEDIAINADGSIKISLDAVTLGGNDIFGKMKVTDGEHDLGIESNGAINVILQASDNNIGNTDVLTVAAGQNLKPATTPAIYNVTCTNAGTEYSQALPANTKKFMIGIRSKNSGVVWQFKVASSGTAFYMLGNETMSEDNILLASQTLYFQSATAGEVVQIIAWA
jgi:hypothetical protein